MTEVLVVFVAASAALIAIGSVLADVEDNARKEQHRD